MSKEMIINAVVPENVRVAVLVDGRLCEFFEETQELYRSRSNVYLGKVTNVEPSLDACFVEYGADRHGFLPAGEIVPAYWASKKKTKSSRKRIETMVRRKQSLLVQVEKEPIAEKGARLTTNISLAGRYLVLTPYSDSIGVSRKIEDQDQRRRAREMGSSLKPPKGMGFIIRTAGRGETKRAFARDLSFLIRLFKEIQKRKRSRDTPGLVHAEADLIQRVLRDYYTNEIDSVWIDDPNALEKARRFFKVFSPRQRKKLKVHEERVPIFSHFKIEEQIEGIHGRKVELPSGGSLVIDQTEALVAIDVNSGKMKHHRGQEETAYETNLEAAAEIGRQLRLRNLGGIIVIDFIDMTSQSHKTAVERVLRKAMISDKARRQIGKISAFGLCTLTRQRLDQPIRLIGYEECPECHGDGIIRAPEAVAVRLLRRIQARVAFGNVASVFVRLHPDLANHIHNRHRSDLLALEKEFDVEVQIIADHVFARSDEQVDYKERPKQESKGSLTETASRDNDATHKRKPGKQKRPASKKPEKRSKDMRKDGKDNSAEGPQSPPGSSKKRRRRRRKKKPSPEQSAKTSDKVENQANKKLSG